MLILPIKKKWFDMMLEPDESRRKMEEYRECNEYWGKRFASVLGFTGKDAPDVLNKSLMEQGSLKKFSVLYRNGYSHNSPTAEALVSLSIGIGKPEWGAEPDKLYYRLSVWRIRRINT